MRQLFILLLLCLNYLPLHAQYSGSTPYHLSLKRELLYGGAGIGSIVLGNVRLSRTPDIVFSDLQLSNISSFDIVATRNSSDAANSASFYSLYASAALPTLLLVGKDTRHDAGKLGVLFGEAMAINYGLTNVIKSIALRPRPYLYDENIDPVTIISSGDRASFLSGHTSVSATSGFFFARTFSDYYPDSKLKPYVWVLGAGVPALTGYLRVKAGRHFPSDVIAGYTLGAAIGYLVPTLHRRPIGGKGFSLSPTGNGFHLAYRFK